jgi:hypothetical protein
MMKLTQSSQASSRNLASIFLLDVPFSHEAARNSFVRTIDKVPPSHRSQQFKDGVLWDNCKQLAETDDVILVTNDRAFYKSDDLRGLASELIQETTQCSRSLRVFPALSDLLREIRKPVDISDDILKAAIIKQLGEHIDPLLESAGFSLRQSWRLERTFYATEASALLYVEFAAVIDCEDIADEGRTDAVLRIDGSGRYDIKSDLCGDLQPLELSVSYENTEGVREQRRNVFASANAVMGHRSISYVVREKLDQ